MTHMSKYRAGSRPYNVDCGGPNWDPAEWWAGIGKHNEVNPLRDVALQVLEVKPSAVDPETAFSLAGWNKGKRRNGLKVSTTTDLTAIQMYYKRRPNE